MAKSKNNTRISTKTDVEKLKAPKDKPQLIYWDSKLWQGDNS